jgi:cysteine desulfurase
VSIYLDHNATTPLRPEVWEAMAQVEFGPDVIRNPSSVHKAGIAAHRTLQAAREQVAVGLGASPEEVAFTGGGSEAINLAIKGAFWGGDGSRRHFISTVVEHHAVLHALEWLETQGSSTTLVAPDVRCRIAPEAIAEATTPGTLLVSVMMVNNEIGTIQPIAEIGAVCRERGVLLHVDAVQALGKVPLDVNALNCDLLSCSAHKLGGPKGVGALYVRKGTPVTPLVHGGPQEKKLRAGTENVQGIVGFAEAVRLALQEREETWSRWLSLREVLYRLPRELDAVRVNTDPALSVPNCVNMAFMFCDGMALATNLSARGIFVSQGSACTAGDLKPSHVLKAMGLSDRAAYGAVRISMGRTTTEPEVTEAVEVSKSIVERLRLVTAPEDIGKCKDDCPCFLSHG